ncbi:MAG: hypothetical protein MK160_14960 [Rhodobacteraceae bacterium]|nr:hypothetical protein [Paracoccaceae bacterium]
MAKQAMGVARLAVNLKLRGLALHRPKTENARASGHLVAPAEHEQGTGDTMRRDHRAVDGPKARDKKTAEHWPACPAPDLPTRTCAIPTPQLTRTRHAHKRGTKCAPGRATSFRSI